MSGGLILVVLAAVGMGAVGLAAFFWTVRAGQYEDLQGAAERILIEDDENPPV
ncbi:cbb3-type cytochrome oxidase assembly protein CcoS [Devosia albogilva]|uniref:Cbb3-type cytochrome oxidase assembly protein CcoS n=1 Tax=Devosia albogilva TaxID=429726 RepID=A0ABW5QH54_9HYPH